MIRQTRDPETAVEHTGLPREAIVSGIKPTGSPHLGNLAGMFQPLVDLQDRGETFSFIADLHALTTTHDVEQLRRAVYDAAAGLVAAGLDPARVLLFRQSDVPEILELAWILATLAPVSLLERAHAYKAARAEGRPVSLGLISYPVLMAADILSFGGGVVPAGADQAQHVEVARLLAKRFNQTFGGDLPLPRVVRGFGPRAALPGLDGRKMSKQYGNTIPIAAAPAERRALVEGIVTDSTPATAPKDPDASPLTALFDAFATLEESKALRAGLENGTTDWKAAKEALIEVLDREVEPVRKRFMALRSNEQRLERLLREGGGAARSRAQATLRAVRLRVGIGPPALAPADHGTGRPSGERLDRALEMTFPASDPVAITQEPHGEASDER